jgi:hypothetical protein
MVIKGLERLLLLLITKRRKFVLCSSGIHLNFKGLILSSNLLQAKMAQQGKEMRVGACKCFPHHSVKLVLLANGNMCELG